MFGLTVDYTMTLEGDALFALQDAIRVAPKTMRKFVYNTVRTHLLNTTVAELRRPTPPPSYPLVWRNPAQRRAVIKKLRAENNLPYQRTGELEQGWKVEVNANQADTLLRIYNNTPYVNQVMGIAPEREPMFPQWGVYPLIVLDGLEWAEKAIVGEWERIVVNPQKGVKLR